MILRSHARGALPPSPANSVFIKYLTLKIVLPAGLLSGVNCSGNFLPWKLNFGPEGTVRGEEGEGSGVARADRGAGGSAIKWEEPQMEDVEERTADDKRRLDGPRRRRLVAAYAMS